MERHHAIRILTSHLVLKPKEREALMMTYLKNPKLLRKELNIRLGIIISRKKVKS